MWFYRRLLRISWKDKRTNDSILEELQTTRLLLNEMNKRKLKYIGHAVRNNRTTLMKTALEGKVEGTGRIGRHPKSYMENVTQVSGLKLKAVMKESLDRDGWRRMVGMSTAAANIDQGPHRPR